MQNKLQVKFCGWHAVVWLCLMAALFGFAAKCARAGETIQLTGSHQQMSDPPVWFTYTGSVKLTQTQTGVSISWQGGTCTEQYYYVTNDIQSRDLSKFTSLLFGVNGGNGESGTLLTGQTITVGNGGVTVNLTFHVTEGPNAFDLVTKVVSLTIPESGRATSDPFKNDSALDAHINLYGVQADGSLVLIGTQTIKAGEEAAITAYGDSSKYPGGVEMSATYDNAQIDANGNIIAGGSEVLQPLGHLSFVMSDVDASGGSSQGLDTSGMASGLANANGIPSGGGLLTGVNNIPPGIFTGAGTGALDKQTMQNATNSIIHAIDVDSSAIGTAIKAGGTGSGGSVNIGDNAQLGGIKTDLDAIKGFTDLLVSLKNGNPTSSDMGAAGSAAGASYTSAYGTATNHSLSGGMVVSSESDPGEIWTLHLPVAVGGSITVDLNPMHNAVVATVFAWFKLVVSVAMLWMFEYWCWGEFKSYAMFLPVVGQAHGNPVLGGTGGQFTALLAAGVVATVISSAPAAYWALFSGSFDVLYSLAGAGSSPQVMPASTGPVGAGFWLVQQAFPVSLLVTVLGQVFIVRKAGLLIFEVAALSIKFVVP